MTNLPNPGAISLPLLLWGGGAGAGVTVTVYYQG